MRSTLAILPILAACPGYPVVQTPNEGFVDLDGGEFHVCGQKDDGTVGCWNHSFGVPSDVVEGYGNGYDTLCLLGINGAKCVTTVESGRTDEVPAGHFVAIDVGRGTACAIDDAGAIHCWGDAASAAPAGAFTAITVGAGHATALADDGLAHSFGRYATIAPAGVAFRTIDAGYRATCGVTDRGALRCWANRDVDGGASVPIIDQIPAGEGFIAVATGTSHACALDAAGSPVCWGLGTAVGAETGGPYTDLATGSDYACGLGLDGSAECWGAVEAP